jgi:hypothetical protein
MMSWRTMRRPQAPSISSNERRRVHRRDVSVALSCVLGIAFFATPSSQAATAADGITIMMFNNGRWWNYDFDSESARSNNVDWPVSILFIGNATIDKAKSKMDSWTTYDSSSGEKKHLRLSNNVDSAWGWDEDGGKKTIACPGPGSQARHYRVYSTVNGGEERLYNSTLGYYVVATTHSDWNECPPIGKKHGGTDATEMNMINQTTDNTSTQDHRWGLHNEEPWRVEGNHQWSHDGWASTISIP